jgi:hypothetical protein
MTGVGEARGHPLLSLQEWGVRNLTPDAKSKDLTAVTLKITVL